MFKLTQWSKPEQPLKPRKKKSDASYAGDVPPSIGEWKPLRRECDDPHANFQKIRTIWPK
jgi:hypothetical protein